MYSNAVTTVSPTYAEEALAGGAAGWLKSTLLRPDVTAKFQVAFLICGCLKYQFGSSKSLFTKAGGHRYEELQNSRYKELNL